jgi:hypothetical protein
MSNFLKAVQYRTPSGDSFSYTIAQCGSDVDKFDFIIHCLTWVKLQCPPSQEAFLCNRYFSSPSIFMTLFTKFGRPSSDDNTFKKFIELITIKRVNLSERESQNDDLIRQIKRIPKPVVEQPGDTLAFYDGDRGSPYMARVESLRKKWLEYFNFYWKLASSWPVNNDTTVFETYRVFLFETLLIPKFSALETGYIDAYKKIESNLGTLTSVEMNGEGLPPMYLSFGPDLTQRQWDDWDDFNVENVYNNEADLPGWKVGVTNAIRDVRTSLDNLNELDLLAGTYDRHFKDDIKRLLSTSREVENYFNDMINAQDVEGIPGSGVPELDAIAREWFDKRITQTQTDRQEEIVVTAEKALERIVSGDQAYKLEWTQQMVPTHDDGIMARWYDWASQFWLKDAHNKWFNTIARLSMSGDIQEIFQATQIILIDDASFGADRYAKFGLNVLTAPQLVYVFTLRNKSLWWRPPSIEESVIHTDAAVDVEEIEIETERMEIIHGRLNDLKESVNEGLLLNDANVVFYTTTPSFIGYCLITNIDIIIYNLWLSKSPISIKHLRDWILRDNTICGQTTRHVDTNTRLLTFVALLALSTSSGIPMYVGFGWDNIYSQWRNIVNEFSKLVPPSRTKPDETCAWLARRVSDGIIINKQLMVPLFARILHSKFAGDKNPTPLKSDYTLWNNKYKELFTEERIGTGRVEPVPVLTSWNPMVEQYYQPKEESTDSVVRSRIKREEAERKNILVSRHAEAMVEWRKRMAELNAKRADENRAQQAAERKRLADKNMIILTKLKLLNDTQDSWKDGKRAVSANKKELARVERLLGGYPTKIQELKAKQEALKKQMLLLTDYGWLVGGEGYEKTQEIIRVANSILELEDAATKWGLDINNLVKSVDLGSMGLVVRETEINTLRVKLNKFIQADGDVGEVTLGARWKHEDHDGDWAAAEFTLWIKNFNGLNNLSEAEYTQIEEPPTLVEIVTIDQTMEASLKTDDMMPVATISSMVKIRKDVQDALTTDNRANSERLLGDIKCVEWAYAQRCHFQDNYYAPRDFDKLIITFGIRFKDWTGAKTITINN